MSFFDGLGEKVKQTSQTAVQMTKDTAQTAMQKTKDTADVVKLSTNLQGEEKKLNGLYTELGKAYAGKYADNYDVDFAQNMQSIKAVQEEIVSLKKQINDLKGMVECPNCGAAVAQGSKFCTKCGSAMPMPAPAPDPTPVKRFCTNCGNQLQEGALFCTKCGSKVEIAATAEPINKDPSLEYMEKFMAATEAPVAETPVEEAPVEEVIDSIPAAEENAAE